MPSPGPADTPHTKHVTGLAAHSEYYFAMRVRYAGGCWSAISNVATVTTEYAGEAAPILTTNLPATLELSTPWPNPARITTRIAFGIPSRNQGQPVLLAVYDALGRELRVLKRENAIAGRFTIQWDRNDDGGRRLRSGVYFVRLSVNGEGRSSSVSFVE